MRGRLGQHNIVSHSRKEQRRRCLACGQTFAQTKGTPFFRLHKSHELMTVVLALLAHGCPPQAIVCAFGIDARTVAAWQRRGGVQAKAVHQHLVKQGQVELQVVQADELWVKVVGSKLWLAHAIALPSRLWLAAEISAHRDRYLVRALADQVRRCARSLRVLVCTDGLKS